jgi:transmembrane sensor
MGELHAPLAEGQRDPIDDARMERIAAWLRAEGHRGPARQQWRRLVPAAAVAAGALVLVGLLVVRGGALGSRPTSAGPLRLAGGELPRAFEAPEGGGSLRLELSDGSRVELARGARLQTLGNDGEAVTLRLDRGRAAFDVTPGGPRSWVVEAGLARVEVVGTRFTVERGSEQVEVTVERGAVRVVGEHVPGGRRRLGPGEALVLVGPPPAPAATDVATAAEPSPDDPGRAAAGASQRLASAADWRPLARAGSFGEAFDLLGAEGLHLETRSARSVDDLFLLADVARRSGHPADAVEPLERIVEQHAVDRRAAVAAFTLGRLHLDVLDRPEQAARAFSRALELGAPPALAEDAHALVVEARARLGDREGAAAAAREYLARYPAGRLAREVRRLAGIEEP